MKSGILYIKLPISTIKFDYIPDDVSLLKESIKTYGLVQPIGVVRNGDTGYKLVFGKRRIKACAELNHKYIHTVILSIRQDEEKYLEYVENLHRTNRIDTLKTLNLQGDLRSALCLSDEDMRFLSNFRSLSDEAKKEVNNFTAKYVTPSLGDNKYFLRMVALEKNIPAAAKDKVRLSVLSDKRIFINEIEKILDLMKAGGHKDTVIEDDDRIIIKKNVG